MIFFVKSKQNKIELVGRPGGGLLQLLRVTQQHPAKRSDPEVAGEPRPGRNTLQAKLHSTHDDAPSQVFYTFYKKPLDSYAYPDQSKRNRQNKFTFLHAKKLFKTCAILRECAQCVLQISTKKPENCQLSVSFKDSLRGLIKLNAN